MKEDQKSYLIIAPHATCSQPDAILPGFDSKMSRAAAQQKPFAPTLNWRGKSVIMDNEIIMKMLLFCVWSDFVHKNLKLIWS